MDEPITAPATDNVVKEEVKVDAPQPQDNALPPQKKEEYSRLLHSSKEEALRLKRENEQLKVQVEAMKSVKPEEDQFTPEENDIQVFKKLAQAAGVPIGEDWQQIKEMDYKRDQEAAKEKFLERYPEYSRVGDPASDEKWEKLMEEVALYAIPEKGKQWAKILEKAHSGINVNQETALERGKALGYAQANLSEQAKLGGGGGGGASAPAKKLSKEKQEIVDGFTQAAPKYFKAA